jgi:dipeptidyl aminopeptidase/acylaminoacyl peptidase
MQEFLDGDKNSVIALPFSVTAFNPIARRAFSRCKGGWGLALSRLGRKGLSRQHDSGKQSMKGRNARVISTLTMTAKHPPNARRIRPVSTALAVFLSLSVGSANLAFAQAGASVERVERGTIVTEGAPPPDPILADKLNAYLNVRSADVVDWTADGKGLIISTRFGETAQLHRVAGPLGYRQQLTFASEPIGNAETRPNTANELLYVWNKGGAENYQFFLLNLATGQSTLVTDGKFRNESPLWNHKGDKLAFSSVRRDGRNGDIYVTTIKDAAVASPLLAEEGSWSPVAFSQDDSKLLVRRYVSIAQSYLAVVDVATGSKTPLKTAQDRVALAGIGFTADGKGAFITSDEGSEHVRLGLYDLQSGQTRWLTNDPAWGVEGAQLSADARRLAYIINEGGWSRLALLDAQTLTPTPLPDLPKGVIGGMKFSPDGKRLALSLSQPSRPSDAYVIDIETKSLTQWTKSETGGLNPERFTDAQTVSFPTFDKVNGKPRPIPAFLYLPKNAPTGAKLPVIISIHGGPEAQSRPGFSAIAQFWANELGAAVLYPNIRGSDGYGKTYLALDNGFKREDSIKDIGALIDWVGAQPNLDKNKIVVAGGSYGGYATLAAMTHYNAKLAGGASTVGISNFITFLEATAEYRRDLRRPEYGDERDPKMRAFLQKISPLTNVANISKPMLIIQGKNDPRVPVGEAEQMVAAIRKNGGEVWYVMATDEGHGFRKKSNQLAGQMAQAQFFRKLFGQGTGGM